jgi:hypothetical protein
MGWSGVHEAADAAVLDQRGVSAPGTVVQVKYKSASYGPNGGYTHWTDVTVAFTDARGTRVRATREGAFDTQLGDRFPIVYDPADPANARWATSADRGGLSWNYASIDLAASLLLGASALWKVVRRRRTTRSP